MNVNGCRLEEFSVLVNLVLFQPLHCEKSKLLAPGPIGKIAFALCVKDKSGSHWMKLETGESQRQLPEKLTNQHGHQRRISENFS
jgi:hypothetical protein